MADIISTLTSMNHFWESGAVRGELLRDTPRAEFSRMQDCLGGEKTIVLAGPRGAGKTTMIFQTIDYLLWAGMDPKGILYAYGGDPALSAACDASPGDVVRAYMEGIRGGRADEGGQPAFIFIDDLHRLKGWREWLQGAGAGAAAAGGAAAGGAPSARFIVSVPSHGMLQGMPQGGGNAAFDAAGFDCIQAGPLTFREFARMCGARADAASGPASPRAGDGALEAAAGAMPALLAALARLPAQPAFDSPVEHASALIDMKGGPAAAVAAASAAAERLLREYLLAGGYPGYFSSGSLPQWQTQLIDEIATGSQHRDIVCGNTVKNARTLDRLMCHIAENDGRRQSYQALASMLGIDFTTVSSHLKYLSDAYLISILESYPANVGKANRKNKRLHLADSGIECALLHDVGGGAGPLDGGIGGIGGGGGEAGMARLMRLRCVEAARGYAEARGWRYGYWRAPGRAGADEGQADDAPLGGSGASPGVGDGGAPLGGSGASPGGADGAYLPEVDAVVEKPGGPLPIAVCASGGRQPDLRGIEAFMAEFGSGEGLVATDGWLDVAACGEGKAACVPFWLL